MDPIASFAYGMDSGVLTLAFSLISNEYFFMALLSLFSLALATLMRELGSFRFLAITAAFALLISIGGKGVLAQPRPCLQIDSKVPCPADFGTPSGHAIIAFAFALALRERKSFPIYLSIALLVSFSRLYLGVHTFAQIAASLALAFVALALARLAEKYSKGLK